MHNDPYCSFMFSRLRFEPVAFNVYPKEADLCIKRDFTLSK